jgi:transposase
MNINLAALPDDVETLHRMVRTLAAERVNLTEAQAEIERLRLIVQKLPAHAVWQARRAA